MEHGWIVCDIRKRMRDPGDGNVHDASSVTVLRRRLPVSYEDDAHNLGELTLRLRPRRWAIVPCGLFSRD